MKSKTALLAIVVIIAIAAAALVVQNQSQVKLRQENAELRQQADQVAALQADNESLSNQLAKLTASQPSQDQMRELVKLRGEVGLLRTQKGQLQSQNSELQKLRDENRQLRERPLVQAAAPAPAPAPAPPPIDPETARNACVNNLRLIDQAKRQFASDHNLTITDSVTMDQLMPYFGAAGKAAAPQCPLGGAYTIGIIAVKPTCSIPGHVLP